MERTTIFLLVIFLATRCRASTPLEHPIYGQNMTLVAFFYLSEHSYTDTMKQLELLDVELNETTAGIHHRIQNQTRRLLVNKVDPLFAKDVLNAIQNDIDECILAASEIHFEGIFSNVTKLVEKNILENVKNCKQDIDNFKQTLHDYVVLHGPLWESVRNCTEVIRVETFTCRKHLSKKAGKRLSEMFRTKASIFEEKLSKISQQIKKIEELCDNAASIELLPLEPYRTHVKSCINKKLEKKNSTEQEGRWRFNLNWLSTKEKIKNILHGGALQPILHPDSKLG